MSAFTSARPSRRPNPRMLAACAVAAAGLAITGGGVYAALNATAFNTAPQAASSGTLSLTMASNGTGFSQAISNLAPGDTVNRYISLTQGDTLDGKDITLGVADGTPTLLTTSATKGLRVTVTSCPTAWTPGTGAGTCSGTPTVLLASTPLSTLTAGPVAVKAGANAASSVLNLQISLALPDQTETVTNGVAPAGTIQGLSSALTWTFGETQRTATVTGS
jgi:spore coat-associated protein N